MRTRRAWPTEIWKRQKKFQKSTASSTSLDAHQVSGQPVEGDGLQNDEQNYYLCEVNYNEGNLKYYRWEVHRDWEEEDGHDFHHPPGDGAGLERKKQQESWPIIKGNKRSYYSPGRTRLRRPPS